MNAKELREAADSLKRYSSEMIRHRLKLLPGQSRNDADNVLLGTISLADYILATVRDDDDEPCGWEWFGTVWPEDCTVVEAWPDKDNSIAVYVRNQAGDFDQYVTHLRTRGDVRLLCRGLGISMTEYIDDPLKEGGQ